MNIQAVSHAISAIAFRFVNISSPNGLIPPRKRPNQADPNERCPMLNFLRPSGPGARVQPIRPAEAVARVASGEITLIDVREGAELAASGKAAGALHVPLMALRMKCDPASPECLPQLARDKPVALYCSAGGRSAGAARMLAQMGYKTVYNLGGLGDWQAGGGMIDR